jgi:hypoxanthine phosphoribosyltransferase
MPDRPTVSIRFSAAEIANRVDEMALELSVKLAADTLVVSVLKGSFVFAADLIRALSRAGADWSMDFLTLSSYGSGTETTGRVRIVRDIVDDVRHREVLLVDDILESGFTLSFAKNLLQERGARRILRSAPCSTSPQTAHRAQRLISWAQCRRQFPWATVRLGHRFRGLPYIGVRDGWLMKRPRGLQARS